VDTSAHPALISESQLRAWLGFNRRADLERHLRESKIPFAYGKGGRIVTTLAAIDSTLAGAQTALPAEPIDFA